MVVCQKSGKVVERRRKGLFSRQARLYALVQWMVYKEVPQSVTIQWVSSIVSDPIVLQDESNVKKTGVHKPSILLAASLPKVAQYMNQPQISSLRTYYTYYT